MKKIQTTVAVISMAVSGFAFSQGAMPSKGMGMGMMDQDQMASMCQKMHPEMSADQCKDMRENMMKMNPEQRSEMCQKMHPEMSADQCKSMHEKMHGNGSEKPGMGGMMMHGHGASGGHQHESDRSAIGQPGSADKVTRTINIRMTDDMKFTPSSIAVKQGETIRFVVSNAGKTKHEMVLGTEQQLQDHYKAMMKYPEMEHADPNMITLEGGKSGEIIWQFTTSGKVKFACLQPGHFDAGMKGSISVNGAKPKAEPKKEDGHDSHQH